MFKRDVVAHSMSRYTVHGLNYGWRLQTTTVVRESGDCEGWLLNQAPGLCDFEPPLDLHNLAIGKQKAGLVMCYLRPYARPISDSAAVYDKDIPRRRIRRGWDTAAAPHANAVLLRACARSPPRDPRDGRTAELAVGLLVDGGR